MAAVAMGGAGAPAITDLFDSLRSKYADWTDILSRELKSWIDDVKRDERNIARHVSDLFNRVLVNPMYLERTPLVEPLLVQGHIWEKKDLAAYVDLFERCYPGSDVTLPDGEPVLSQAHDFALEVMEWAKTAQGIVSTAVVVFRTEESALTLTEAREALGTMALLGQINERHRAFLLQAHELTVLADRVMAGIVPLPPPVDYVAENTAALARIKAIVAETGKVETATLVCMEETALRAEAEKAAKEKREADLRRELARLEAENASMR